MRSGNVPPMIQMLFERAISASAFWIGPSPGVSAIASLSRSCAPMKQKYSGSAARRAPSLAACATSRRALARLRSTLGVDTVCKAAIFIDDSSPLGRLVARRCRRSLRLDLGNRVTELALDAVDLRVGPRPGNAKLARSGLRQRLAQEHLREKSAEPDGGVDHRIRERRGAGVDLGDDDDAQVLRLARDVGVAFHQHDRLHAAHAQVVGVGDALVDAHVTAQVVEREAFLEQVAKVERETARQRLQAEHAEQARRAGLRLEKLAAFDRDIELAGKTRVVDRERRAEPRNLAR